jgi:hypothetical protein
MSSDYRIKENVQELNSKFTVDNLKPVIYENKLLEKQSIGFLAHEVQEIYPYLVTGEKDGKEYQSLDYIGLIGILVKEIKELKENKYSPGIQEINCGGKNEITNNKNVTIQLPEYIDSSITNFNIQITEIYNNSDEIITYKVSDVINNCFTVYGKNSKFYWKVSGEKRKE